MNFHPLPLISSIITFPYFSYLATHATSCIRIPIPQKVVALAAAVALARVVALASAVPFP
jgi:hypothetical protein